jgi:hypothetical protein
MDPLECRARRSGPLLISPAAGHSHQRKTEMFALAWIAASALILFFALFPEHFA